MDSPVTKPNLPPAFGGNPPKDIEEFRQNIQRAKEAWLSKTESLKTRIAYSNDLDQFLAFHGIDPIHIEEMTRIVPAQVTKWRDYLLKNGGRKDNCGRFQPAENSTVARKLTALRSFFSFLQNYGYRGANPAHPDFVKSPPLSDKGLTPAITSKLMARLLDEPGGQNPIAIRDTAILSVFAYMAVRVEELQRIRVGNIARDGEHTIIRIKGKGNTIRRGVVPPIAAAKVNGWIEIAELRHDQSGPLFRPARSARGQGADGFKRKSMSVRAVQKLVKKYCFAVGIDNSISVHSLRVTAATEALCSGVKLVDIQHWLGHRDPRTTLRYIRGSEHLNRSPAYAVRYG